MQGLAPYILKSTSSNGRAEAAIDNAFNYDPATFKAHRQRAMEH